MQPADFVRFVYALAKEAAFPLDRFLVGGDHLGPNAWQHLLATEGMPLAETRGFRWSTTKVESTCLPAACRSVASSVCVPGTCV